MIYDEFSLLMEEYVKESVMSLEKRVDLVIVDIQSLYALRPSLYKLDDKNILELLDVDYTSVVDTVDSVILSKIILMSLTKDRNINTIISGLDQILYDLFEEHKILSNFDITNTNIILILEYISKISATLDSLLERYIAGHYNTCNLDDELDLHVTDKVYFIHSVQTLFNNHKAGMFIAIKLYSNRN